MASHPFQAHQGNNETGQPPPLGYGSAPPQAGASYNGGYTGYGVPNGAPPPNAGYGYGAPPPNAGYGYGAPPLNAGYGYGAPQPNAGNGYNGAPTSNAGYGYGASNTGFSMDALGNIGGTTAYGYGAPNPSGYAVVAPGYPNGGALGYPSGGGAPGSAVYPEKPPGYAYGGSSAVYPVGVYYPPPGGGALGGVDGQSSPPQQQPVNPRNQIQTGRWASGLCSCCDNCVPNLLLSWCCPFIPLAQVYARLGLLQYKLAILVFCALYLTILVGKFAPNPTPGSTIDTYTVSTIPPDTEDETFRQSMWQLLYSLVTIVGQLLFRMVVWQLRSKVRQRFQIPGSACGDCCTSCCCSCCAIAQLATHVKSYTPGSCSFGPPDVLPPFP